MLWMTALAIGTLAAGTLSDAFIPDVFDEHQRSPARQYWGIMKAKMTLANDS